MSFSKASYAIHVAAIMRRATLESAELAQGMWNPMYCSADASDMTRRFCEDMQRDLDDLQAARAKMSESL